MTKAERIQALQERIRILGLYLGESVSSGDLHACRDAAADIEIAQAELRGLTFTPESQ